MTLMREKMTSDQFLCKNVFYCFPLFQIAQQQLQL